MRVLVATPCGGSMLHTQYFLSFMETFQTSLTYKQEVYKKLIASIPGFDEKNPAHVAQLQHGLNLHTFDIGIYALGGESLLARGRNHCAQVALTQGWDKIFFIDSDEGWTWADFHAIVTSPHPITAGVVPLKAYHQYPHSFQTSLNYLPFLEDEKYFKDSLRTLESTIKMAEGHGSHRVKVAFTGTGYLCIDTSVFAKLAEMERGYLYPNPQTGQCESHWDFFGGGPVEDQYQSEDWSFCHKAREAGYDIVIDTNVRPSHTGPHTFKAG